MKTGYFNGYKNDKLFYRVWNLEKGKKALIIIHRGHEHSERLNHITSHEKFKEYKIFAFDLRGHGYSKADASPIFMDSVRDLDIFVNYLFDNYSIEVKDIFLLANSIGAVIASSWVHDYARNIAGMALLAPAFDINLYVPFAKEGIALLNKLVSDAKIKSYVKSKMLTHDVEEQKKYDEDKLITKDINAKLLVDLLDHGKRVVEDSWAIKTNCLVVVAGKDYVVKTLAQKKFYLNLGSKLKKILTYENSFHGILFEENREELYNDLYDFMEQSFDNREVKNDLDRDEESVKEFEAIKLNIETPLNNLSFKIQKKMLNHIGDWSKGMEIGLEHGFDSGASLNYVYENRVRGKNFIGKMIDKNYLNAIGWKGIRERKKHLISLVEDEIKRLNKDGKKIKILDVAGGTGNYLFDIYKKYDNLEIVINEFKQSNIDIGEKVIKEKEYKNIRFTNFDCFDIGSYKKMEIKPDIVIISGIFELFEDNKMLNSSVEGVKSILSDDGMIFYTGQPWHPQLKQIAYVLNSHQGASWIMRRRAQDELDKIFRYSGFIKDEMLIDNYGIFTVSSARLKG